jgi:hypothetical protein
MLLQARNGLATTRQTRCERVGRAPRATSAQCGEMTKERMGVVSTQMVSTRAKSLGGRRWLPLGVVECKVQDEVRITDCQASASGSLRKRGGAQSSSFNHNH